MTKFYRKALALALALVAVVTVIAQESFHGSFAEPADGGNLDVVRSTFDGTVAFLVPRGHESEALGTGTGARRWRNMLFALRGVKGRTVTFRLPAQVPGGAMVHNMDSATLNLLEPVWSYDGQGRRWSPFDQVDCLKPAGDARPGFPEASAVDNSGKIVVRPSSVRRDDYGWVFQNTEPFTEDVVYVSINEHYAVNDFYAWLETDVFTHPWVAPTASESVPNSFLIGYQAGASDTTGAFGRAVPDAPLYAFQIKDPSAQPTKVVVLVSGQHPYEGQTKAALEGAVRWILDPHNPAAAAYRAEYTTLVYPLVNPTGEMAGLWRGTAFDPRRDINRNWHTAQTDPLSDRGIDTVIIHKQAMLRDVAAIGLGQPHAVVDLHQNYGDQLPSLHYVLHHTNALASAWVQRLRDRLPDVADVVSNSTTTQTLRGYWQAAGAAMTLCIERSTYSTLAAERDFGGEMMRAFVPASGNVAVAEAILSAPAPATPSAVSAPAPDAPAVAAPAIAAAPAGAVTEGAPIVVTTPGSAVPAPLAYEDDFAGEGSLAERPLGGTSAGPVWTLAKGQMTLQGGNAVSTAANTRAFVDAGTADARVQTQIQLSPQGGFAGLLLRGTSADDFYFFRIQPGGWSFGRVSDSRADTLASGRGSFSGDLAHTLEAEAFGSTLVLKANGQVVHSALLPSEPGATRFGLSSAKALPFASSLFRIDAGAAVSLGGEGGRPSSAQPVVSPPPAPRAFSRMVGPAGRSGIPTRRVFSLSAVRSTAAD